MHCVWQSTGSRPGCLEAQGFGSVLVPHKHESMRSASTSQTNLTALLCNPMWGKDRQGRLNRAAVNGRDRVASAHNALWEGCRPSRSATDAAKANAPIPDPDRAPRPPGRSAPSPDHSPLSAGAPVAPRRLRSGSQSVWPRSASLRPGGLPGRIKTSQSPC